VSDELINEDNFSKYFFDVRSSKPHRGQCMARYTAMAELVDGNLKRDIIYLLSSTSKVSESIQLLRKIALMGEEDAINIALDIARKLNDGQTSDDICEYPHEYKLEAFYYTQKEHVPKDDPHWDVVELTNLDEFIEETEGVSIKSKIVMNPTEEEIKEFKDQLEDDT